VLRCAVASLDQGIQYRGALKFDHRCPDLWEGSTLDGYTVPDESRENFHAHTRRASDSE
jgi:hypothetical protein